MPNRRLGSGSTIAMKSENPKYQGFRVYCRLGDLEQHGAPKDPSGRPMVPSRPLPEGRGPKPRPKNNAADKPKSPKLKATRRQCLTCKRSFKSTWDGNRICTPCRNALSGSGFLEGVTG